MTKDNAYVFLFDANNGIEESYMEVAFASKAIIAFHSIINKMNNNEREESNPDFIGYSFEDVIERVSTVMVIDMDTGVRKSYTNDVKKFLAEEQNKTLVEIVIIDESGKYPSLKHLVVDLEEVEKNIALDPFKEDNIPDDRTFYDFDSGEYYKFRDFFIL